MQVEIMAIYHHLGSANGHTDMLGRVFETITDNIVFLFSQLAYL